MVKRIRGVQAVWGVAFAWAAACGCAAESGGEVGAIVQPLYGATSATPATVRREIGRWVNSCEATLIAPQWALSAGHCGQYYERVRLTSRRPFQTLNDDLSWWVSSGPGEVDIERTMFLGERAEQGTSDLMLLRLAAQIPSTVALPAPLASAAPTAGLVTTWGMGGCGVYDFVIGYRESPAGVATNVLCPYDGGAPWFVGSRASRGALFAISSANQAGRDVVADVAARRTEILGIIAEWDAYPGTDIDTFAWCAANKEQRLWGDVDGDRDPDALCHHSTTGARTVAQNHRRLVRPYPGASTAFCQGAEKTLLTGDFNGDGRTDFLCHAPSGTFQIDYAGATAAARYGAVDWSLTSTFCSHATGRIHTGDFDGDGRSDLMCHDTSTGQIWVEFADGAPFTGRPDWDPSTASRWCGGANRRLYVGEFNGDGATDLLCHSTDTGTLTTQLSDHNRAPFASGAADDSVSSVRSEAYGCPCPSAGQRCEDRFCRERLCVGEGTLRVLDVSGDGRSDVFCEYSSGRSYGYRAYGGRPDGVDSHILGEGIEYILSVDARLRPRTAQAASRPSNRW